MVSLRVAHVALRQLALTLFPPPEPTPIELSTITSSIELLPPWRLIHSNENLCPELKRELFRGHPLYRVPVVTIARRDDCDDALFYLSDGSNRVAMVHLGWPHKPSKIPGFPFTVIFESFRVWAESEMTQDHNDYGAD